MKPKTKRVLRIAPLAILGMAVFIAVGGVIVRLLWNWVLPPLFGWHTVTFWQALGLLALCRILFGGLGVHGTSHYGLRRRMAERCDAMTPEERERFRQRMHERWGFGPEGDPPRGATS